MLASERGVTEVCFEVGYGSLGSFSSKFRGQFGRSLAAFQREVRRIFGYSAPLARAYGTGMLSAGLVCRVEERRRIAKTGRAIP